MHTSSPARNDTRTVTVGLTDTPLLGPNPQRKALILVAPSTNRYTVSFNGTAVLDAGLTIYPGQAPVVIDRDTYGDWTFGEVRAISAVAPQPVTVIDVFT